MGFPASTPTPQPSVGSRILWPWAQGHGETSPAVYMPYHSPSISSLWFLEFLAEIRDPILQYGDPTYSGALELSWRAQGERKFGRSVGLHTG